MPTTSPMIGPADAILADAILTIHIAAGFLALTCGSAIILMRKGDGRHRQVGWVFSGAMMTVAVTALALCLFRPNDFLLTIALFSAYLTLSGWWAMASRRSVRSARAVVALDWALALGGMATALAMLGVAGMEMLMDTSHRPVVLLVFGLGIAAMAGRDMVTAARRGGLSRAEKLARHIQRMMGAWIASLTAFAVVNLSFLPDLAVWLGPTALVTPLITYWSRRYAPKVKAVIA
ncbi:hypothetical protein KAJ83_02135 [Marivibrio halodurans]|uniref:DUF2306 domain-containing protein n=1 Tax=Marivibrio halodurans TaxID=2039722 RepID=A0A8J7RWP6_9PROT|nr:hypothetical protein [Marivibrio halodurans]MBP5855790.1 hypothetical protein [Marivibrio halodurans]